MVRSARLVLLLLALFLPIFAGAAERVTWTASLPPGATGAAEVTLNAKIEKGWHLYSMTKTDGPTPTSIEAVAPLALNGAVKQGTPIHKFDQNFQMNVEFYENTATFTVPVKLAANPTDGKLKVSYQTCNDNTCDMPKTVEVPLTGEAAKPVVLNAQAAGNGGLLAFLGVAFVSGLIALLTPCVFPMIPITVSYFSKRRENLGTRKMLTQALAYCLGIIGAYTAVGLVVAILFGASSIQRFATNPWVNLGLAVIFVLLALSLFGMLQMNLPSKVTNAFSPHGKSGLLAPLLMGLTFTLTSFTCTGPFVGTILVSATNGDKLYPFLGMLVFSATFALPFFLLALFPQLLSRLPKSGAWMETVKAFMGFVEVAAAIKFVSNADLVWGTGLISRPTFLVIWAVILALAGLFLLRVIRLPKVDVPKQIGAARWVVIAASLAGAVWLLTGIGGRSLGDIEAFLPPTHADGWIEDYDMAIAKARAQNKPLMIDFTGVTCTNCRWMERNMFPRPPVAKEFKNYILVKLFTDRANSKDQANAQLEQKLTGAVTLPVYVVVTPDERMVTKFESSTTDTDAFVNFLKIGHGSLQARR